MGPHRKTRQRVCAWMIGVLLFAQWLTAAYACPAIAQALATGGAEAVAVEPVPDCHAQGHAAMDPANPAACKAHCDGEQPFPLQPGSGDLPAPLLGWFIVSSSAVVQLAGLPGGHEAAPRSGAPPGWPPIYLTHLVLRN
jgi:hypothetical protein